MLYRMVVTLVLALVCNVGALAADKVTVEEFTALLSRGTSTKCSQTFAESRYRTECKLKVGTTEYWIQHIHPRNLRLPRNVELLIHEEMVIVIVDRNHPQGFVVEVLVDKGADGAVDVGYMTRQPPFDKPPLKDNRFVSKHGSCLLMNKRCKPVGERYGRQWQERYDTVLKEVTELLEE